MRETVTTRRCRWHDAAMFRLLSLAALVFVAACAGNRAGAPVAPTQAVAGESAPAAAEDTANSGGEASSPEKAPEVVRTGKAFKLDYGSAVSRYGKGARCGGGDAPETVLGAPDQRNEMQQGKVKLITYGFRYREGTLLIRCRADKVEVARTLK
jgi:hypothetical protein